jgi:competence protein ComEA
MGVVMSDEPAARPPRSANVEPSSTPPWRVLETPPPGEPPRAAPPVAAKGLPVAVKVAAGIVAAIASAGLAVAVAVSGGDGEVRIDGSPSPIADSSGEPAQSTLGGGDLVAEIVGAVQAPGVYRLRPGSRVADLVGLAGGYGPRVDARRAEQELNLAAPVKDGEHIRVPSRDDQGAAPGGPSTGQASQASDLVDINTASQAQLEDLPGVGPATAQKIIAAREEARFGAVEELRSRGVLGEKTFEKLRPLVTVG